MNKKTTDTGLLISISQSLRLLSETKIKLDNLEQQKLCIKRDLTPDKNGYHKIK